VAALVLMLLPTLPAAAPAATESDDPAHKPAGQSVGQVLRTSPELQMLFVVIFLGVLVIMGFDVLSSIAVRDILQADERLFGILIGLVGLGSVLAGLGLMFRKQKVDPWRDVILGLALLATLPLTIALGTRLADPLAIRWLVAAGAFIGGMGNGLIVIQISTLLQLLSPEALLGRLSGLFQSTIAAAQLITIVLTPLIVPALLSIGAFFAWSTLLLGLVALYTAVIVRRQASAATQPVPIDQNAVPSPEASL
jgi:MFS family permease